MGKGDIKTKKGKITNNSFGKLRPHKASVAKEIQHEEPEKASKK